MKRSLNSVVYSGTLGDDRLFETFFVCVNQGNNENVRLTYGKAPSQREVGTVHGTFMFPLTKKESVSFYTFAAGEHKVTIDDVRVVKDRPAQVQCGGDGSLVQVCRPVRIRWPTTLIL